MRARAHARIAVEGPQANAHLREVIGVAAEEMRSAFAAEALLEAAVRVAPGLHQVFSLQQLQGASVDPRLCRSGRAGAPLAAGAVAVVSHASRLGELETDAAAQAAAGS
jgi:hypothetical protein